MPSVDPFVLFGAFFGVVVVIMIGLAVYMVKNGPRLMAEAEAQVAATWAPYASSRGFRVLMGEGPWHQRTPVRVQAAVEGIPVTLHHESKSTSTHEPGVGGAMSHDTKRDTVVLAHAATPWPLELKIYTDSAAASAVAALLGWVDVRLGDAAFDHKFAVRTQDERAARALLDDATRQRIMAFPRDLSLHYERGAIRLAWSGHEADPAVLDAGLSVVAALARAR